MLYIFITPKRGEFKDKEKICNQKQNIILVFLLPQGGPIYRQIIDQVKTHIATGRLEKDEFLSSFRQVAKELEINPITVLKFLWEKKMMNSNICQSAFKNAPTARKMYHIKKVQDLLSTFSSFIFEWDVSLFLRKVFNDLRQRCSQVET
ncbi:MAG: hypothetical protein KAQ62_03530 [Cyclobacteriaceae bacterium]|nr:hypothetical protein [Cyclobacteriaceae bacterium]